MTIPNMLSLCRLIVLPILAVLAWRGEQTAFLIVLGFSLATDSIDGPLARHLHQDSDTGARLDSIGDVATYATLPLFAWWLWPDIMRREAVFVIGVIGAYFLPLVVGFLRFGRMPAYHTWLAKISAVLMAISVILLFADVSPWPFRLSAIVPVLGALEELSIIAILPEWRTDIPSIFHALRLRRGGEPPQKTES